MSSAFARELATPFVDAGYGITKYTDLAESTLAHPFLNNGQSLNETWQDKKQYGDSQAQQSHATLDSIFCSQANTSVFDASRGALHTPIQLAFLMTPIGRAGASLQAPAKIFSASRMIQNMRSAVKTMGASQKIFQRKTVKRISQNIFGNPDVNALSAAGRTLDRGGLSKAGRGIEKHGNRVGSVFPRATGSIANKNILGQHQLDDILTHPSSGFYRWKHPKYGNIIDVRIRNNRGVRYRQAGEFIGFLEP